MQAVTNYQLTIETPLVNKDGEKTSIIATIDTETKKNLEVFVNDLSKWVSVCTEKKNAKRSYQRAACVFCVVFFPLGIYFLRKASKAQRKINNARKYFQATKRLVERTLERTSTYQASTHGHADKLSITSAKIGPDWLRSLILSYDMTERYNALMA